jgi:hypothetical protein
MENVLAPVQPWRKPDKSMKMENTMNATIIKGFMTAVLAILVAGTVSAADWQESQNVNGYAVTLNLSGDPLKTGSHPASVTIKDGAGGVVSDAKVSINYNMHCMQQNSGTVFKEGKYQGTLNFSMAGEWTINVKITRSGKTTTASFNVKVK